MKHVTLFMDGYLFPHKELRKHFEESSAIYLMSNQQSAFFTKENVQELCVLLNSFITQDIALTNTKEIKIRNSISQYEIFFQSYLDFMSCMDAEGKFNFVHTKWIQALSEEPYDKFGKSTRMAIEKSIEAYKLPTSRSF